MIESHKRSLRRSHAEGAVELERKRELVIIELQCDLIGWEQVDKGDIGRAERGAAGRLQPDAWWPPMHARSTSSG